MQHIRLVKNTDLSYLKEVLDSIDLFPSALLDDMIADFLRHPHSSDIWFTCIENHLPVSIGFCAPEKMAEGTYNLYAIGVHASKQGQGIGKKMMQYIEDMLIAKNQRVLIVDTSGTETFTPTRKFYEDIGYTKEAVIRDFWAEGDDKVTYYKKLN